MAKWLLLLVTLLMIVPACAIYPDPASETRTKVDSEEAQPPPEVEKIEPPRQPSTTCPPAMRGSC